MNYNSEIEGNNAGLRQILAAVNNLPSAGGGKTGDGVRCSEIGMTTDDANGNNFALLRDAIAKSDTIIVDDMYVITAGSTYAINKNIRFVASGEGCGFTVSGAVGTMFDLGDNCYQLSLEYLTIINNVDSLVTLFLKNDYTKTRMHFVKLEGCYIEGRVSLFRFYQNTNTNPAETPIGVDLIRIANNKVVNNRATFCVFSDVTYDTLEIIGNNVLNFDNYFVTSGVTNETAYNAEITAAKKMIIVRDNDVYCDDTWYHNPESTSAYYNFVLAEGVKAVYQNNRVEGMKSQIDVALYDAYLSCADVLYEGNYWKNNCVLVPTSSNVLMKAKGNANAAVGVRKYINNTFVIDTDFYEKHNAAEGCYVRMIDSVSATTWDVIENEIDVPHLQGFAASTSINGMRVIGNKIHAGVFDYNLAAGVELAEVLIDGNVIDCVDGSAFGGVRTGSYTLAKCTITNNTFRNCRYAIGNPNVDDLLISGNTIIDRMENNGMMLGGGTQNSVNGANNKIVKENGFYSPNVNIVNGDVDYEVDLTYSGRFNDRSILYLDEKSRGNIVIRFSGAVFENTFTTFDGYVSLQVMNGKVKFTASDVGETIQTIGSEKYYYLEPVMFDGVDLPFAVRIALSTGAVTLFKATLNKCTMNTHIITEGNVSFYIPEDVSLPAEYQRVMYIETDGTQYVQTGVTLSDHPSGLQFAFDGAFTGFTSTANGYLFGGYGSDGGRLAFSFKSANDGDANNAFTFWAGNLRAVGFANIPAIGKDFSLVAAGVTTDATNATATLDGVAGTKLSGATSTNKMPNVELYLFTCKGQESVKYCGKLYKFAINGADGTPIRNFVPCYRISDNVIGLYDAVGGTFYENAGEGAFVKGANL